MKVPTELKIIYLRRRLQDIEKLRLCLDGEDFSFAQKMGHQIKGNAVTFDFPQIAGLGFEMERAAQERDKERIKVLMQRIEGLLQTARMSMC
jgi:HPt (histidine-containing phosphotransfer) domain-containing protein